MLSDHSATTGDHPSSGLALDGAASDQAYRRVRAAFEEHSVLLFRDQKVSDDIQAAFSRAFGPLELVKVGSEGSGTFYSRLHNLAADGTAVDETHRYALTARANQLWHTDRSFKRNPALASVLSARIVASDGGETEVVSTRQAWNRLSSAMRARLRDAIVTHSYAYSRDQIDTELIAQATRPEFIYRHHWRVGDVLMWDNRATMHRGRPWPSQQTRSMVRTTISALETDGVAELRPA